MFAHRRILGAGLALAGLACAAMAQNATFSTRSKALSISVPNSWVPFDSQSPAFQKMMKALAKTNPKMAQMYEKAAEQNTFELLLMDSRQTKGFSDNLNISARSGPTTFTQEHIPQIKKVLGSLPFARPPLVELRDMPFGKAIHYSGTMNQKTETGATAQNDLDGWFIANKSKGLVYTLSISVAAGTLKERRPFLDKMVSSIKLK